MIRQKFGYPNDDVPSGYHGLPLAARPGHSKHERGEAIDIHIKNGDFELYHKFFDFMVSVSTIQLWWLGPRDMGHIETKFQYPGGSGL